MKNSDTQRGTAAGAGGAGNSDSDVDNEILLDEVSERSRLRRGLAHIKSRVKAKASGNPGLSTTLSTAVPSTQRKDTSPTGSSSLRGNFLRKRRKDVSSEPPTTTAAAAATTAAPPEIQIQTQPTAVSSKKSKRGIINAKKDVEIESGVEMLEDMIPIVTPHNVSTTTTLSGPLSETSASYKKRRSSLDLKLSKLKRLGSVKSSKVVSMESLYLDANSDSDEKSRTTLSSELSFASFMCNSSAHLEQINRFLPILVLMLFFLLALLPVHDFVRGIFATLLVIILVESCGTYMEKLFEFLLVTHPAEKTKFQIPDYSKMPICEIPAVEEHKTIKTYAGWLNEINSYDPNTFSFTMTRSVYVRLDGTVLKLSGTNARVPKRVMWNEQPIDRARITFTDHRTYNLLGCRIELLPLGLAKKRYFNRKYPIQLIIKTDTNKTTPAAVDDDLPKLEPKEAKTVLQIVSTNVSETQTEAEPKEKIDFAATVLSADLQKLQNIVNPDTELRDITVPCGDEVRLLLFTRSDREKEDWYRRFVAASKGKVHDQDLRLPSVKFVDDADLQAAAIKAALNLTSVTSKPNQRKSKDLDERSSVMSDDSMPIIEPKYDKATSANAEDGGSVNTPDTQFEDLGEDEDLLEENLTDETFEGLLMSACAARNPANYIRFMSCYQRACNQSKIPIYKSTGSQINASIHHNNHRRKHRRAKRQEDELWKGIDQSLFLGPSGSIVWANVLLGRCMYSCLHDDSLQAKIQDFLQKKLNSIKLPNFMESVNITQIHMGQTPFLIHRISQPMLDERGTWLDADITYEGLAHITVTTKLNLLRMKRPKPSNIVQDPIVPTAVLPETFEGGLANTVSDETIVDNISGVIYDSDAESSGSSSTETESPLPGTSAEGAAANDFFQSSPGNARRIFKIVDRIATSNLFQYATELPYVQRAMENMSANITLRVDVKGLVARATINMPPPPSDRIWLCFRGPPRLWIRAKPTVGDKSVDWSIVTNVIESKLCEAVNKYLVFPNMVDFTLPFLGKPDDN